MVRKVRKYRRRAKRTEEERIKDEEHKIKVAHLKVFMGDYEDQLV